MAERDDLDPVRLRRAENETKIRFVAQVRLEFTATAAVQFVAHRDAVFRGRPEREQNLTPNRENGGRKLRIFGLSAPEICKIQRDERTYRSDSRETKRREESTYCVVRPRRGITHSVSDDSRARCRQ